MPLKSFFCRKCGKEKEFYFKTREELEKFDKKCPVDGSKMEEVLSKPSMILISGSKSYVRNKIENSEEKGTSFYDRKAIWADRKTGKTLGVFSEKTDVKKELEKKGYNVKM